MDQLKKIGYPPVLTLVAGVVSMGVAAWSIEPMNTPMSSSAWGVYTFSCLLFTLGTVLFCIRLGDLTPSWALTATTTAIAGLFALAAYLWLIPVRGEPVIFHPVITLQFFNLVWLVIAFVMAIRTINHRD